jgi:hypothetical protein
MPLSLSDDAMAVLLRLAAPLSPDDRALFLQDVAAQLREHCEIGDGLVARVAAEMQRRYLHSPLDGSRTRIGRWH